MTEARRRASHDKFSDRQSLPGLSLRYGLLRGAGPEKGRAAGGSVRAAGAVPGRGGILPLPAGHRGALSGQGRAGPAGVLRAGLADLSAGLRRFLQPGRADLPAAAGAVQAADRRAFISRRRDRDGAQRGARIRPRGAGASGDPRRDRVRFPRRADPQGDAGAGHAAVRCSKAAGEGPRLRGVSRRAHHAGRAGPARFSGRFPRGRARPSAKAVSRVSDGFAVRRVGTLNQAVGR